MLAIPQKLAFRTTHQFKLENPLPLFGEALAISRGDPMAQPL
jgi:hypothetical protein